MEDINEELIKFINENNIEEIKKAIAAGADVNARDEFNTPSLILAVLSAPIYSNDKFAIVKLLVEAGANVNQINRYGISALLLVSYYCDTDIVSFLLEHGADPMIKDRAGFTPLDIARMNKNFEVAELLRSYILERNLLKI